MPQNSMAMVFDVHSADELGEAVYEHLRARVLDLHKISGGIASCGRLAKAAASELWFCDYGTLVELSFTESDCLRVQIPLTGSAETTVGKTNNVVAGDKAFISKADASVKFQPNYRQFAWRVPQSTITRKLAALTGNPVTSGLRFNPEFDLSTQQGCLMRSLIESFARAAKLPSAPLLCSEIEQAMISVLLSGPLQENFKLIDAKPLALNSHQIRVVEEYIEAHWDQPLDYEILAVISGVSVRSLFRTFKAVRGYTPMDFAKKIRLSRAREILENENLSVSITTVAQLCGYSSLSTFSRDFAKAYGIPPSMLGR